MLGTLSPLDWNPDPKCKSYMHVKHHHDLIKVIDLEARQNSVEIFRTANGTVSCYDTYPAQFLEKTTNIKDGTERFINEETTDNGITTEREVSANVASRG